MKLFGAILSMVCLASSPGLAATERHTLLNAHRAQGSCEFSHVRVVKLTNNRHPYVLTVRSFGLECRSTAIMADISLSGRSIWREALRLTAFQGGGPSSSITFNPSRTRERSLVRNWASIENTGQAPTWLRGAIGPQPMFAADPTVYLTTLRRAEYERVRRALEPMICIPIGPGTGHCIAALPRTGHITVFIVRGVVSASDGSCCAIVRRPAD
jgi:hypothetical protein